MTKLETDRHELEEKKRKSKTHQVKVAPGG